MLRKTLLCSLLIVLLVACAPQAAGTESPAKAGEVGEAIQTCRPPPPFRESVVNRPERAT